MGPVIDDGNARRSCYEKALAGLHAVVDVAELLLREVEELAPFLAVGERLLEQHEEVAVQDEGPSLRVVQQVGGVLGDAGGDEAELPAFRPQPGQVADGRGMPEEPLHLVDVEPRRHAPVEIPVHAVADELEGGDHAERAHAVRKVSEAEAHHGVVELHVAGVVEDGQRAVHISLQAKRDEARLGIGLVLQLLVNVPDEHLAPLLLRFREGLLEAAAHDGALGVGLALVAVGHRRAAQRDERLGLRCDLELLRLVGHVGDAHRVEEVPGVGGEPDVPSPAGHGGGAELLGGIEDDDLVVGVGEARVGDLALGLEALAASGFASHEAHGACEFLAVGDDEVQGMAVLAVVAAAFLVELEGGEGALDGDLVGEHVALDVDLARPQGEDGVQPLQLPVAQGGELDAVRLGGGHQAHDLVLEFLAAGRVGHRQAAVAEQVLAVIFQAVEHVLRFVARVAQLRGEQRVVIALLDSAHLVLHHLLVDPVEALLHEGERLVLLEGSDVGRDDEGDGQVNHVGQAPVRKVALEAAERHHLAPHAVDGELVVAAVGLEVHEVRRDEVLGRRAPVRGELRPVEAEGRLARAQDRMDEPRAFGAVQRDDVAADAGQHARGHRPHAREHGDGAFGILGLYREGDVALAHQVRHPFEHLRVQDVVVLRGERAGGVVTHLEEGAVADLRVVNGPVDEGHLHADIRREAVVEHPHALAYRSLRLVARRLVADVAETIGAAVGSEVVHRNAVAEQRLVGNGFRDVAGALPPSLAALLIGCSGLLLDETWAHSSHRPSS